MAANWTAFPHFALSALALVATLSAPAIAEGFVLRTTADGTPLKWPDAAVTVYVDSSVTALDPGALAAVERGFAAWQAVSGGSLPMVNLVEGAADAVGFAVGTTNRCTVRYEPCGYAPAGDALAITVVSFEDDGTIVDADIVISGRPNREFAVLDPSQPAESDRAKGRTQYDIEEVVTHEAGHFFGLAHNNADPSAVMYFETDPDTTAKRTLTADDEAGILAIYPENANSATGAVKVGCSLTGEAGGSSSGWAWLAATLLGAVALGARRRRP